MKDLVNISSKRAALYLRPVYLIWVIVGMVSLMIIPSQIIVEGDAATTTQNIVDNELLFSLGIARALVTQLLHIAAALLLYKLFAKVDGVQAKLMVILSLISVPMAMISNVGLMLALSVAKSPEFLQSFDPEQINGLVQLFLNANDLGIVIASIFWGLWLFPLGALVYKSGYLPKVFAYALYIGGFGYLFGSFLQILSPGEETVMGLFDLMTFGEVVFLFWLILIGAKVKE